LNLHWSASLWAILGNGQDCRQFCQKFAISRSYPPPPPLPGQPKNLNFKFCVEFQVSNYNIVNVKFVIFASTVNINMHFSLWAASDVSIFFFLNIKPVMRKDDTENN
jgi:hypothetical protein